MKQFTIQISDAEEKALTYVMIDIQVWLQNAISNRARQAMDEIISKHTNENCKVLDKVAKEQLIMDTTFKTAAERTAEQETLIFNNNPDA